MPAPVRICRAWPSTRRGLLLGAAGALAACAGGKPGEIRIDAHDATPPALTLRVAVAGDARHSASSPGASRELALRDANSVLAIAATAVDSGSGVQAVRIYVVETRMSCVTPAGAALQVCTPSTMADSLERPAYDSVVTRLGAGVFVQPATVLARSLNLIEGYPPLALGPGDSVRQTLSFFGAAQNHAGKESRSEELRVTWVTRGP